MCDFRKDFKRYAVAVANCGKAVRIYEGVKVIGEVVKDDSHAYLTANDFSLVEQVYKSIKDLEERRFKNRIKNIIKTSKELQAVA